MLPRINVFVVLGLLVQMLEKRHVLTVEDLLRQNWAGIGLSWLEVLPANGIGKIAVCVLSPVDPVSGRLRLLIAWQGGATLPSGTQIGLPNLNRAYVAAVYGCGYWQSGTADSPELVDSGQSQVVNWDTESRPHAMTTGRDCPSGFGVVFVDGEVAP